LPASRESLLNWKVHYGGSPCANIFKSANFYIKTIVYTRYFNEEVNCTEPSRSVSVPWSKCKLFFVKMVFNFSLTQIVLHSSSAPEIFKNK
jgi:hypothetical protein